MYVVGGGRERGEERLIILPLSSPPTVPQLVVRGRDGGTETNSLATSVFSLYVVGGGRERGKEERLLILPPTSPPTVPQLVVRGRDGGREVEEGGRVEWALVAKEGRWTVHSWLR